MKKECEDYLWDHIIFIGDMPNYHNRFPRDVINEMIELGMIKSPKQAWRTLEKWSDKGLYEWGSIMDLGWKLKK